MALDVGFPMVSWRRFWSNFLEPKPANLPSWPSCSCQLQFLLTPHQNQCHQLTLSSPETILLTHLWCGPFVLVVSAPGVVCWWWCVLTTYRHVRRLFWWRKEGCIGGYLHLLQAPFGAATAKEHCLTVPFWSGIAAGVVQVQYWLLRSRRWQGGQWESARCANNASCIK